MMKNEDMPDFGAACALSPDTTKEHRFWLAKAEAAAHKPPEHGGSPHPSVKVGAVLVGADGKEIASGANRFAHGVDWCRAERYEDGSRSMWFNCAEQMVLASALRQKANIEGARLYVTLEPCTVCAGLIAECGIREVIVPLNALRAYAKLKAKWQKSVEIGLGKLTEAGVKVTTVDMGT